MPTLLLITLALFGCNKTDDTAKPGPPSVIMDVAQGTSQVMHGLHADVEVLYNEHGVPTIFGHFDADVARVHGT